MMGYTLSTRILSCVEDKWIQSFAFTQVVNDFDDLLSSITSASLALLSKQIFHSPV